jgi:hypothetical protein
MDATTFVKKYVMLCATEKDKFWLKIKSILQILAKNKSILLLHTTTNLPFFCSPKYKVFLTKTWHKYTTYM